VGDGESQQDLSFGPVLNHHIFYFLIFNKRCTDYFKQSLVNFVDFDVCSM